MTKEKNISIDPFELSDDVLEALYLARTASLLVGHGAVNSLADQGASLIFSFGRVRAREFITKDFVLTEEEKAFMDSIVTQVLADIDKYRAIFEEIIAVNDGFQ